MRAGYRIVNEEIEKDSDCVIVSNYKALNEVCNYPFLSGNIKKWRDKNDIGVWKTKTLK